jgi:hypothetical protein
MDHPSLRETTGLVDIRTDYHCTIAGLGGQAKPDGSNE